MGGLGSSTVRLDFMTNSRSRYLPARPFPPYSYVSGLHPHPISDPRGHSYGLMPVAETSSLGVLPTAWGENATYLFAVDLFNHGYYWEAHESWEMLWHVAGRTGNAADFFKSLIHLAAAGVKAREHRPIGVARHARRALQLIELLQAALDENPQIFFGIELGTLSRIASQIADQAEVDPASFVQADIAHDRDTMVWIVFTQPLTLT